ncbi:hypothetical protein ACFL29_01015 [Patescibacteria group bacterium]
MSTKLPEEASSQPLLSINNRKQEKIKEDIMRADFVWGVSGTLKKGEILSLGLDPNWIEDGVKFKVNSIDEESQKLKIQGLAFYSSIEERAATIILDPKYKWVQETCSEDPVGDITFHP